MPSARYRTFGKAINVVDELRVTSIVAKAAALTWGMATTILLSVYTAGLTAQTTSANFASTIKGVADMANKQVGVASGTSQYFMRFGWIGQDVGPFNTESDGRALLAVLMAPGSRLDGLVIDAAWAQYHLAHSCEAVLVGPVVQYQHLAFALSPYVDPALAYNISVALVALNADSTTGKLADKYFPQQDCPTASTFSALTPAMTTGMWIVVASMAGLACLLVSLPFINRKWDVDVFHATTSSKSINSISPAMLALAASQAAARPSTDGATHYPASPHRKGGSMGGEDYDD
ncbi:PBPe domain-containing protein [Haematococcus lacustris]|uniref:PBPe domain-containing protein n=1 Tax=Haematococcus lacustris TaxID=44745 RepID=A0A699ZQ86_HAELA|nr:PBPe domain-containing protein [Haematococcus lacustris]